MHSNLKIKLMQWQAHSVRFLSQWHSFELYCIDKLVEQKLLYFAVKCSNLPPYWDSLFIPDRKVVSYIVEVNSNVTKSNKLIESQIVSKSFYYVLTILYFFQFVEDKTSLAKIPPLISYLVSAGMNMKHK